MRRGRGRWAALAALMTVAGLSPIGPLGSTATAGAKEPPAGKVATVRPSALGGWTIQEETCGEKPTGSVGFVEGPGEPPLGTGSLRLAVGRDGFSRPEATLNTVVDRRLDELNALAYSTFTIDESHPPYLELATDSGTLRFDPPEAHPDQWIAWDARAGTWTTEGGERSVTISEFLVDHPEAIIVEPGLRVATGCDPTRPDATGHVDAVDVALQNGPAVTYDFEPDRLVLSVADVRVHEGEARAEATITLSGDSADPVTVAVSTPTDGQDTAGPEDFAVETGTVTIEPGARSGVVDLAIVDDVVDEDDETFTLTLSDPSEGVAIAAEGGSAVVTIVDNDAAPVLAVASTEIVEGAAGPATVTVELAQTGLSERTIAVDYETRNGTANATDHQPVSGRLTLRPDDPREIRIPILADQVAEGTEQFSVLLSNPTNVTLAGNATVTVHDDDAGLPASIRAADTVAREGRNAAVRLTRTGEITRPASVNVATAPRGPHPATSGTDFTAVSRTATFDAGVAHVTLNVPVADDGAGESAETFLVTLSNPVEAVLSDSEATVTIVESDTAPAPRSWLAAADTYLASEGDARRTRILFEVHRTGSLDEPATVDYATNQGSALQGSDFIPVSGQLTFGPGQSYRTVEVAIAGDDTPEAVKSFELLLSNASGAVIADAVGVATIADDDVDLGAGAAGRPAVIVVDDAVVVEGDSGTTAATFTVRRLGDTTGSVGLRYSTGPGVRPAASPNDYSAVPATSLTLAPGVTEQTFTVPVAGDTRAEKNERFVVYLTNPSRAVLADSVAVATIVDDDGSPIPAPDTFIAVRDAGPGPEGGTHTFSIVRRGDVSDTSTVKASTASGAARSNIDFTARAETLTFGPGETEKLFTVAGIGDAHTESHETFVVRLSGATDASVEDSRASGTLLDDDPGRTISSPPVTVAETDAPGQAVVTVALSDYASQAITVGYRTTTAAPGLALTKPAATAGDDFGPVEGTIAFAPGQKTQTISIPIVGDNVAEPAVEQFAIELFDAVGAALPSRFALVDLVDDDAVTLRLSAPGVVPESVGSVAATVTLSGPATYAVTVDYATASATATAGADYTSSAGRLTFAPGETKKTITIGITADALYELTESFQVALSSPSGAGIDAGSVTVNITDDDPAPRVTLKPATAAENEGTIVFTVELDRPSGVSTVIEAFMTEGTADRFDYSTSNAGQNVGAGGTRGTITVPIVDSYGCEGDEFFEVDILVTNAVVAPGAGRARGTIRDLDCAGLTVHDTYAVEGTQGDHVRFSLDEPRSKRVRFSYAPEPVAGLTYEQRTTSGGLASRFTDFDPTPTDVVFDPGQTSRTNPFPIVADDGVCEQPERLRVRLVDAGGVPVARGVATITILDDDCPGIQIVDLHAGEGESSQLRVLLPDIADRDRHFSVSATPGTATSPEDYDQFPAAFTALRGRRTATIAFTTNYGAGCQPHETFTVTISSPDGELIARDTATATIYDLSGPCFTVAMPAPKAVEGEPDQFRIEAVPTPLSPVTVGYSTADGDAIGTPAPNADYQSPSEGASVVVPVGASQVGLSIPIVNDNLCEGREGFRLSITPARGIGTTRPVDIDDPAGQCADTGFHIYAGSAVDNEFRFSIALDLVNPSRTEFVRWATREGSATAGVDFEHTFGETELTSGGHITIRVPLARWSGCRPMRRFTVQLYQMAGNSGPADGSATAVIGGCR